MKKFLCLALAAAMAFGTAFAFSACDKPDEGSQGQTGGTVTGQDPTDTDGPQNEGPQDSGTGPQSPTQDPDGVPAVDKNTRQDLIDSVLASSMESGRVQMSFRDVDCRTDYGTAQGTYDVEAYYLRSEEGFFSDTFLNTDPEQGKYALAFSRGQSVYYANAVWADAGVGSGDFGALLSAYREKDGLHLTAVSSEEEEEPFPTSLAVKLAMNLPRVAGKMTLKAVPGGYEMNYNLVEALKSLMSGLSILMGTKITPQTTVGSVLQSEYIDTMLNLLFEGVQASEVTVLPIAQKYKSMVPPPGEKDFYTYLKDIIASESYYAELPLKSVFEGAKCLGDLTIENILSAAGLVQDEDGKNLEGEELTAKVSDMLRGFNVMLNSLYLDPVGGILDYVYGRYTGGSYQFTGGAAADLTFRFDAGKSFTGVTVRIGELNETSSDESVLFSGKGEIVLSFGGTHEFADLTGIPTVEQETENEA